jgi:glutathione S-transferase/nicotinamidase-related amidase
MTENLTKRALLVIDLQQDFISPEGPFKDSHVNADHIISNLTIILPHFRDHHGLIVWTKTDCSKPQTEPQYLIRPEGEQYANVPLNDAFLAGTHKTFPICVPGTDGEKFIAEVDSLIHQEKDIIVIKTFYSAFTKTNLSEILKDITEVHICGLMTNVCVHATAADAFFHGYKVFIWTDCLGYRNERRHRLSLESMKQWYATLISSNECLPQRTIPKPVLYFVNGSISSWRVMLALYEKGIDFEAKRLKVMCIPKETQSPEFLAINPRGLAPTLVDTDGSVIGESLAILHYLEKYYPNTLSLIPTGKAEHIRVFQLIQESQNLFDIYEPLEEIVYKTSQHQRSSHKDTIVKILARIDQELTFWEKYLTKTVFVACNQFTLADCAFYPIIRYLIHRGLDIDSFPALKSYVSKNETRPAAIQAHPTGWKENGGARNVFKVVKQCLTNSSD